MSEKVVVAGAGFGGVNTALKLARKGYEVTIIDKESYHEYKPGVIDLIRGRISEDKLRFDLKQLFSSTPVDFYREKVLGFNVEEQKVETDSGSHDYDYLVVALGAEPEDYGMDLANAENCYDITGTKKLRDSLGDTDSAVVVGSGYVGIETATEIAERGIDVTIVDTCTRPACNSNEQTSQKILDYLNSKDISFRGGCRAEEVKEDCILTDSEEEVKADTVVWSGGIRASKVVRESFDAGRQGLKVNSGLCSEEYEKIFAIGDSADSEFLKVAQNAEEQAEVVTENIDKGKGEALEEYEEGRLPLLISLGDTAVLSVGDWAFKNKLLRKMKDMVRLRYVFNLKKRKLRLRLGI